MLKLLLQSTLMLLLMTMVTGFAYPLLVTMTAHELFPRQAEGSLIRNSAGIVVGSELLGQQFSDAKYFHSRPSATSPYSYNASGSCGSNLGPTNPDLVKQIDQRIKKCKSEVSPDPNLKIPIDLVTTSASGLDPDISVESALYQVKRVAAARGMPEKDVLNLINQCETKRQLGLLGEPRVNVLKVNLLLDGPK